ncbi:MAG: GNAT family protein [Anaerolineae bacterium]
MIQGKQIRLRAVEPGDLPDYHRWLNDPEVIRYLKLYTPLSMPDEEDWYRAVREDASQMVFAIETEAGQHIGNLGLMRLNWKDRSAELGIVIGNKSQWGKGYAQDAIQTLLNFAFEEMNLNRIYLRVYAGHTAAITVYRKCGFVEEGRLREETYSEGRYHDMLVMGILKREFEGG